jgi:site-specific recombinase XerD
MKDFPHHLSEFLTRYLPGQVGASTNTVLSYRDTFKLLLRYCQANERLTPDKITMAHLDRGLVERFLAWLETEHGCAAATRNVRLTAIRSFARYMQYEDVEHLDQYQQLLAITVKKTPTAAINYLTIDQVRLLLAQPDTATKTGRRDLAMITLMYDTAARVQEIADLTIGDFRGEAPATVTVTGKGNKTRIVPLMAPTAELIRDYIREAGLDRAAGRTAPLFPNRSGTKMTRAGIAYTLRKYADSARAENTTLPEVISPHTLRHSKAMHLLQAGVNLVYIRDILGHADLKTTEIYARIDSETKRKALEQAYTNMTPTAPTPVWQQDKSLLDWLTSLGR